PSDPEAPEPVVPPSLQEPPQDALRAPQEASRPSAVALPPAEPSPATPRTSAPLDEGADEPPPAEPLAVELQRQTWAESQIEAPDLPAEPVRAPAETDAATPTPPVEAPAEVNAADALPNDT